MATADRPPPALVSVARAELWAAALAARVGLAVGGLLLFLFTWSLTDPAIQARGATVVAPYWVTLPATLFCLAMALSIWDGEGPGRRAYFHSLPVERFPHHLLRNAAGWVWAVTGTCVLYLWVPLATRASRGTLAHAEPWMWAAPLVVATVVFLLTAAAVTALRSPLLWLGGGFFLFLLLGRTPAAHAVLTGRYGVVALLGGIPDGPPAPTFSQWAAASALWLAAGLLALCLAARLRRDP